MLKAQIFEHKAVAPLAKILADEAEQSDHVQVSQSTQKDVEWGLLEMVSDAALVSPIGFAESVPEVQILKGACVSAFGATDSLNLYFKPGLHHFTRVISVDVSISDQVLAGIILREKYRMTPTVVQANATVEEALQGADAVLVKTPREKMTSDNVMDIVDEWWDMTQLPYVQFLFAGWKNAITPDFDEALAQVGQSADKIALDQMRSTMQGALSDDPVHQIPGHYRYVLDEEALQGLNEYYRFAFFHGLHKDIPDITLWQPDEPDNDSQS